jgi:hypothetical protein
VWSAGKFISKLGENRKSDLSLVDKARKWLASIARVRVLPMWAIRLAVFNAFLMQCYERI